MVHAWPDVARRGSAWIVKACVRIDGRCWTKQTCVNSSPDVSPPYTELEVPAEDIIDDKVEVELLKYDPF